MVGKYQVDHQVATSHVQILTASEFAEILCKANEDKETLQVAIFVPIYNTKISLNCRFLLF